MAHSNLKDRIVASLSKEPMGRLDFIMWLIKGSVFAFASMTVYPIIQFLYPPKSQLQTSLSTKAARIDELPVNTAKIFPFANKPAILIHTASDEYKAFSAACTHLNCTVHYEEAGQMIGCACHNGRFGLDGRVISGPPPKPLEEYRVVLNKEEIIVSKA